jgi:hypothetical protein
VLRTLVAVKTMDNLQLILPICLVGVAAVIPLVGYWFLRRVLKEEQTLENGNINKTTSASTTTNEKFIEKARSDLMDIVVNSTESMETDDGVETYLPSSHSNNDDDDVEAQQQPHRFHEVLASSTRPKSQEKSMTDRAENDVSPLSSVDSSHRKDPPEHSRGSFTDGERCLRIPSDISKRERLRKKMEQQLAQIDVHSCKSETCEVCRCREKQQQSQQQNVQFVSAQKLDPGMIYKLKNAPESARWWEMGESFYDLYQRAQRRAAKNIHHYYRSSSPTRRRYR